VVNLCDYAHRVVLFCIGGTHCLYLQTSVTDPHNFCSSVRPCELLRSYARRLTLYNIQLVRNSVHKASYLVGWFAYVIVMLSLRCFRVEIAGNGTCLSAGDCVTIFFKRMHLAKTLCILCDFALGNSRHAWRMKVVLIIYDGYYCDICVR
jgi:hypothetical protein